jgi:hypothetical protein
MKTRLLPLIVFALLIFGCKDIEEPSPNTQIKGKYQYTSEGNMGWSTGEFNFVSNLVFKADGTVDGEDYTKEIGSDEILGYRGYFSGTYSIMDGKVTISYEDSYYMGIEDVNYLPKADLTLSEGNEYYSDYAIAEDYSALSYICPPNAFCTTLPIYNRID